MRILVIVIVLLVVGVVGLGFYQGWFGVASDSTDGKRHIQVTVDTDKIKEDEGKALQKVHDLTHTGKDKVAAPSEKSNDQAPPPLPTPRD